jgi:uncharacterized protein YegJ (DUF2314 family)
MRKSFLLLIIACILVACGGQSKRTKDPVIMANAKDSELEQAKREALSTLNYFIKTYNSQSADTNFDFSIKADFVDNGVHEHMWISLNKIENEMFQGILGNEPQTINNIKYGDLTTIYRDQIEDWMIFNNKTKNFEGGYSTKVLLKRQNK